MEGEVLERWEKKVCMGYGRQVSDRQMSRVPPSAAIVDHIMDSQAGYCFADDKRTWTAPSPGILMKLVCEQPELRARFFNEKGEWRLLAASQWLEEYSVFLLILMVCMELGSGAPAQGTELMMAWCRNTRTRLRNLAKFDAHTMLTRTYHKGGSIQGVDKYIPHSLDVLTSDLVQLDLFIARPIARAMAKMVYGKEAAVNVSYLMNMFVQPGGMVYTTDDLSTQLQLVSMPIVKFPMKVNPLRHIMAGFIHKKCPAVQEVLATMEADTIDARQFGHTRMVEEQHYVVSHKSNEMVAEEVLPAFLDCSTNFQVCLRIVPGGVELPYSEVRQSQFDELAAAGKFKVLSKKRQQMLEPAGSERMPALDSVFLPRCLYTDGQQMEAGRAVRDAERFGHRTSTQAKDADR
ncbi:hypothetical protein FISHEDRAFT_75582 [Fistulina hepatica ATCC 64428]|uniref:Uncharacterized protein n=1 Tax=Fistulina hepatica ATCC 64428 TaxID=1128425 RepID=A0A0D7A647_9AGAR|nr:hypothetical protein FISHEDRAFT_75582 [Fistulina hepatica ATCC 64428]